VQKSSAFVLFTHALLYKNEQSPVRKLGAAYVTSSLFQQGNCLLGSGDPCDLEMQALEFVWSN